MTDKLRRNAFGLLMLAALLAGCSTTALTPGANAVPESEETQFAASPANIASLTEVVQRNPGDPQAYNMRGSVLGLAGRPEEALADFNKAISLDARYAQAYANRASVYRQMNKLDLAPPTTPGGDIDRYSGAYLGRGIVYRQNKQAVNALQDFNQAIAIRPDTAEAYFNRGLLYQGQRQHQYAIDDFSTAVGLATQQAEPLIARGLSYIAVNDFKAAAGDFDEAVGLEPQNLQAWTSRGLAYERLGDKEKAAGSYARAMNIKQDYDPARSGFARVGGQAGQTYQTF